MRNYNRTNVDKMKKEKIKHRNKKNCDINLQINLTSFKYTLVLYQFPTYFKYKLNFILDYGVSGYKTLSENLAKLLLCRAVDFTKYFPLIN